MASGEWWVVEEGFAGDVINALAHPGLTRVTWTVTQSAKNPGKGSVGPFATQALAQAQANTMNGTSADTEPVAQQAASNAVGSVLGLPTLSNTRNLVVRASKVIIGLLLVAIGATKLFHIDSAVKDVAPIVAKGAALA
jgi:hypothetical protein